MYNGFVCLRQGIVFAKTIINFRVPFKGIRGIKTGAGKPKYVGRSLVLYLIVQQK
jgi:hypothetical protein